MGPAGQSTEVAVKDQKHRPAEMLRNTPRIASVVDQGVGGEWASDDRHAGVTVDEARFFPPRASRIFRWLLTSAALSQVSGTTAARCWRGLSKKVVTFHGG